VPDIWHSHVQNEQVWKLPKVSMQLGASSLMTNTMNNSHSVLLSLCVCCLLVSQEPLTAMAITYHTEPVLEGTHSELMAWEKCLGTYTWQLVRHMKFTLGKVICMSHVGAAHLHSCQFEVLTESSFFTEEPNETPRCNQAPDWQANADQNNEDLQHHLER
jgi:hypothetical protein